MARTRGARSRIRSTALALATTTFAGGLVLTSPPIAAAAPVVSAGPVASPTTSEAEVQRAVAELERLIADQQAVTSAAPAPCTITFSGDGGTSAWFDGANWSSESIPKASDVVCVPAGRTVVHSAATTTTVAGLDVAGTLETGGGTLDVDGTSRVANLKVTAGAFGGSGDVEVTGTLSWTGGRIQGTGTLTLAPTATGTLSDSGSQELGRTLINRGTLTSGTPTLVFRSDLDGGVAVLDNRSLLRTTRFADWTRGPGAVVPELRNTGTFNVETSLTTGGLTIDNTGTFDVFGAVFLTLESPEAGSAFGGTVRGPTGTVRWAGEGWEITADIDINTASFGAGTNRVAPGARLVAQRTSQVEGTTTIDASTADVSVGLLSVSGGALLGSADLATRSLSWFGGRIGGSGTLTITSGGVANLTTTTTKELGRTLVNRGTLTVNASLLQMRNDPGGVGAIENHDAATLTGTTVQQCCGGSQTRFDNAGTLTTNGSVTFQGTVLDNGGTLSVNVGSTRLITPPANLSDGTLSGGRWEVSSGTGLIIHDQLITTNAAHLVLGSFAELTDPDGISLLRTLTRNEGTLEVGSDQTVEVAGSLVNDGVLTLGAETKLDVGADFEQTSGGTLGVVVTRRFQGGALGTTSSSARFGSSTITAAGTVQLAGTLDVQFDSDPPSETDEVVVVDGSTLAGTFGTASTAPWRIQYRPANGSVVLVGGEADPDPIPPTIVVAPQSFLEGSGLALVAVQGVGGNTPVDVPVTFIDGTATSPADFTGAPQVVRVVPGATALVAVPLADDVLDEDDEAFTIVVGGSLATITILDDDLEPRVVIDDVTVTEGTGGSTTATVTVRLVDVTGLQPRPSGRTVSVFAATNGVTAQAFTDYQIVNAIVTFAPGQIERTISVPIVTDDIAEPTETFTVSIGSPSNVVVLRPTATVTILDDDAPVEPSDLASDLSAARADVAAALPQLAGAFDLDGFDLPAQGLPGFELPVVTDDLASALGTTNAVGDDAVPFGTLSGPVDQVLDQLEASGVTIDWIEGGVGGRPSPPSSTDAFQGRFTVTVSDLAEAAGFAGDPFNDEFQGAMEGLAASLGLDGDLTLSGDLAITVVFGIDTSGFYLSGDTELVLEVGAVGTVSGAGRIAEVADTRIEGTAEASVTVGLGLGGDSVRRRVADLAGDPYELLQPRAQGEASLILDAEVGPASLRWTGSIDVATDRDGAVTTTLDATLAGSLTLPEITSGGSPGRIVLDGAFDGTTWTLTGGLEGTDLALDGFTIGDAAFSLQVGPRSFRGSASLDLEVPLGGPTDVVALRVDLEFDLTSVRGSGLLSLPTVSLGSSPRVVYLEGAVVGFTFDQSGADASIAADVAVLLPEPSSPGVTPAGVATGSEVSGAIDTAGNVALDVGSLAASIGGSIDLVAGEVSVSVGPDATGPLVSIGSVGAAIPELDGLSITFTGLRLSREGRFGADAIDVDSDGLASTFGIADLLPFDVTDVTVSFPDPEDLDRFEVEVLGGFDLAFLDGLPFTPIVGIGADTVTPTSSPEDNRFRVAVAVDSLAEGQVRPTDLGPITLGIADLEVGDVVLGAQLTLGGYQDGEWVSDLAGSVTIESGIDGITGDATVDLSGSLDLDGPGARLDLTGAFTVGGRLGDDLEFEDANLAFSLGLAVDDAFALTVTGPSLKGAGVGRVAIELSDLVRLVATDLDIDFDPPPGQPPVTLGSLSVEFDAVAGALAGWGGTAGNLGIDADFRPVLLPGFFIDVTVPDGERFGLPDYVPLGIDEVGIRFPNLPSVVPPGGVPLAEAGAFAVRFSGGIIATERWPISATVDGLEVDLGLLVAGRFPITNLDGAGIGVEPFELVPGFRVGGSLAFGSVDVDGTDVFYGRLAGEFSYEGIGAGIDLVVSEYGPVLAQLQVPVGIPLDPTGLVLASVEGGLRFGGEPFPDPDRPLEILRDPAFDTDIVVTPQAIAASVARSVRQGTFTWDDGFTLAVSGNLTHLLAPGVLSGQVTLGANIGLIPGATGLKLIGKGDLDFYGMPYADAAVLFDLTDPLSPRYDMAFETPSAGSPLGFVLPARAEFEVSLDTEGLALGSVLGVRSFVERLASGSLTIGQTYFTTALDTVAARLEADHAKPLSQMLLDLDGNGSVSAAEDARSIGATFVVDRLLGRGGLPVLFAIGAGGLPTGPAAGGVAAQALLGELLAVAGTTPGLGAEEVLASIVSVIADATAAAGSAFLDVFDPRFLLRGQLQPLVLGIPFGTPDQRVELVISREGISFGFDTSVLDIAKKVIEQAGPFVGQPLTSLLPLMTLGFKDNLGMTFQLPLAGVAESLLGGDDLPTIDPFDGDWAIELRGGLEFLDFQVGRMTGVLVPPQNESFLETRIQRVWEDPSAPIDPARIPVQTEEHYDALFEYGGVLLTGQMFIPELLTDPAGLLASLDLEAPENPLEIPAWISDLGATLQRIDEPARVQVFLPSFTSLLDVDFEANEEADRIGFNQTGDALKAELEEIFGAAYLEGTWNGRLLSLPIGNAAVSAGADGVTVTGQVPLLGAEASFVLDAAEAQGADGSVRLPRAAATVEFDTDDLQATLTRLGLPPILAPGDRASSRARLLTPGYAPGSSDPFERSGGIELATNISIEGLVESTDVRFAITPPPGPGLPDVAARASVSQLTPLGGVTIRNALVDVRSDAGAVTIGVQGDATILGVDARVEGSLAPDLTGTLSIDLRGSAPRLAGFDLDAALVLVIERDGSGALRSRVALDGTVGLPAWLGGGSVEASGELDSSGRIRLDLDAADLRLGGFQLERGTVSVTGDGTGASVSFDAGLRVLGSSVTAGGTVAVDSRGPNGSVQVALDAAGGSLAFGPVALRGQVAFALTPTSVQLGVNGTASVPGLGASLAVTGTLESNGTGTLALSASTVNLKGFSVARRTGSSAAVATIARTATSTTMAVNGQFDFVGTQVAVAGSLSLAAAGPSGSLALTVASTGSSTIGFGGWNLEGGLTLALTPTLARISVNTRVDVPGVANDLVVTGSLDTNLLGSLSVSVSSLRLGGSSSALSVSGAFSLSRTDPPGSPPPVITFAASGAALQWTGFATIALPSFSIASNGAVSAAVPATTLTIGDFTLALGASTLEASASPLTARVRFGGATLSVRGLAEGPGALSFPAFTLDTTGSFAVVLASGRLGLDALSVTGQLVLERAAGTLRLRVTGPASSPARVSVPGLGSASLNEFSIATNGTFSVSASTRRLGPTALHLRDASFTLRKTSSALSSIRLDVSGGRLGLPVGDGIPLPSFSIDGDGEWQQDLVGTGLNLGPALRSSSNPTLRLRLSGGVFSAQLVNPVSVTVLANSVGMQLTAFRAATDGTFTGTVTGRLGVLGYSLAQATFNVSRSGPAVRMTIPSANPVSVNLGPTTASVSGFVQSDGRFDLSGSGTVDLRVAGIGLVGTANVRMRNSGMSGTVTGRACAGACITLASAAVTSAGNLVVSVAGLTGTFRIWNAPVVPADRTAPLLAPTPDIAAAANIAPGSRLTVNYPTPAASDDSGVAPTVSCAPASGTTFAVGATTVTCTATDGAGNRSSRSFLVTVTNDPTLITGLQLDLGAAFEFVAGGFEPLSPVVGRLFSDPIELGTSAADAEGVLRWTITIPEEATPGEHHVVLEGVDPDGSPRLIIYPVTIVGDAVAPPGPVPEPTDPPASGPVAPPAQGTLARTGQDPDGLLAWSAWLLILGVTALLMARRPRWVRDR